MKCRHRFHPIIVTRNNRRIAIAAARSLRMASVVLLLIAVVGGGYSGVGGLTTDDDYPERRRASVVPSFTFPFFTFASAASFVTPPSPRSFVVPHDDGRHNGGDCVRSPWSSGVSGGGTAGGGGGGGAGTSSFASACAERYRNGVATMPMMPAGGGGTPATTRRGGGGGGTSTTGLYMAKRGRPKKSVQADDDDDGDDSPPSAKAKSKKKKAKSKKKKAAKKATTTAKKKRGRPKKKKVEEPKQPEVPDVIVAGTAGGGQREDEDISGDEGGSSQPQTTGTTAAGADREQPEESSSGETAPPPPPPPPPAPPIEMRAKDDDLDVEVNGLVGAEEARVGDANAQVVPSSGLDDDGARKGDEVDDGDGYDRDELLRELMDAIDEVEGEEGGDGERGEGEDEQPDEDPGVYTMEWLYRYVADPPEEIPQNSDPPAMDVDELREDVRFHEGLLHMLDSLLEEVEADEDGGGDGHVDRDLIDLAAFVVELCRSTMKKDAEVPSPASSPSSSADPLTKEDARTKLDEVRSQNFTLDQVLSSLEELKGAFLSEEDRVSIDAQVSEMQEIVEESRRRGEGRSYLWRHRGWEMPDVVTQSSLEDIRESLDLLIRVKRMELEEMQKRPCQFQYLNWKMCDKMLLEFNRTEQLELMECDIGGDYGEDWDMDSFLYRRREVMFATHFNVSNLYLATFKVNPNAPVLKEEWLQMMENLAIYQDCNSFTWDDVDRANVTELEEYWRLIGTDGIPKPTRAENPNIVNWNKGPWTFEEENMLALEKWMEEVYDEKDEEELVDEEDEIEGFKDTKKTKKTLKRSKSSESEEFEEEFSKEGVPNPEDEDGTAAQEAKYFRGHLVIACSSSDDDLDLAEKITKRMYDEFGEDLYVETRVYGHAKKMDNVYEIWIESWEIELLHSKRKAVFDREWTGPREIDDDRLNWLVEQVRFQISDDARYSYRLDDFSREE